MNSTMDARHLTDAELLDVLDGELRSGSHDEHLERCDLCAAALEELRADSRLVSEFLVLADFEGDVAPRAPGAGRSAATGSPPDAAPGTAPDTAAGTGARQSGHPGGSRRLGAAAPWLKAAAIVLLVAGPLAAIPGVRAWVREQVAAPPESAAEAMQAAAPTVLRFTPDPGDFVVRFEPGTRGTITLERAESEEAELRATGGEPETVVSASSLQIRNDASGTYRLRLPATISGVWVRIGDRAVAVSARQLDRRAVVELGR